MQGNSCTTWNQQYSRFSNVQRLPAEGIRTKHTLSFFVRIYFTIKKKQVF